MRPSLFFLYGCFPQFLGASPPDPHLVDLRSPRRAPQMGPRAPKYSLGLGQLGPWVGLKLDLGWGSTWTRGKIMEPGPGTWIMEPGPGTGLNLDLGWGSTWTLDGAQPGISGSPVSLRGMLKAGRNFGK